MFWLRNKKIIFSLHTLAQKPTLNAHAGRGGPTLTLFFLIDEGREDSKTLHLSHHGPTSETPFYWWADGGPKLNAGLVAL